MTNRRVVAVVIILAGVALGVWAAMRLNGEKQESPTAGNDLTATADPRLKTTRTISFTTNQGTWMSLDVSPDGKTIVFDMVGDIYSVPTTGGKATVLTHGFAYADMPRFSPDGQNIAYVSDSSGTIEPWVMHADGSGAHQITQANDPLIPTKEGRLLDSTWDITVGPTWSRDGQTLLMRRMEDVNNGSVLWSYPAAGGGRGSVLLSDKKCPLQDSGSMASNGGTVYVTCGAGTFLEDKFAVGAFDVASHKMSLLDRPQQRSMIKPLVSPDGHWLAYVSRAGIDREATLWLRALQKSGKSEDVKLGSVLQHPTFNAAFGEFPGYAFTPDSQSVIISSDGRITQFDIATKKASDIPFTVDVNAPFAPLVREPLRIDDGLMQVKFIDRPNLSPDGTQVVFSAVGKVWISDLNGSPRRLTKDPMDNLVREFDPVFSPDGKSVAFATWSDVAGGRLCKAGVSDGAVQQLAPASDDQDPAHWHGFATPRFTPDGKRVLFLTSTVRVTVGPDKAKQNIEQNVVLDGQIGWLDAQGGAMHFLPVHGLEFSAYYSDNLRNLSVSQDGATVYFWRRGGFDPEYRLESIPFQSTQASDARVWLKVRGGMVRGQPSPDGHWLALESRHSIFLAPMPQTSSPVAEKSEKAGKKTGKLEAAEESVKVLVLGGCAGTGMGPCTQASEPSVIKLSSTGGFSPSWSADGQWISWNIGPTLYRAALKDVLAQRGAASPQVSQLNLSVPQRLPQGDVLLRGARLVTMKDGQILENADLLISGRRIKAIGAAGSIPAGNAKVIDVSGKTIIPGLTDMQMNLYEMSSLTPQLDPTFGASLAYGVTTGWAPGQNFVAQPREEIRRSGRLIGARSLSGGELAAPDSASAETPADILHHYQVAAALGAINVQFYAPWTPRQRQWALLAAQSEHLGLTVEGGKTLRGAMEQLHDGVTGIDHFIIVGPLKRDVQQLFAQSGTYWEVTIMPSDFSKPFLADSSMHRAQTSLFPLGDGYPTAKIPTGRLSAEDARDVLHAGGSVVVGSETHGPGDETIKEMMAMADGGMTNEEVIRCATINAARGLGLDSDLGSIETGKIADLVVLNQNPLDKLTNLTDIVYVMQDGFVYDGPTLNEVWPGQTPYPLQPWQKEMQKSHAAQGTRKK